VAARVKEGKKTKEVKEEEMMADRVKVIMRIISLRLWYHEEVYVYGKIRK